VTVSDSSTIARRFAILRQLPTAALLSGLDYHGERIDQGDTTDVDTFAAYLDETARRLAEK
jgi:hypothetical protein